MYCGYELHIWHMVCKYVFPACSLQFHFVDGFLDWGMFLVWCSLNMFVYLFLHFQKILLAYMYCIMKFHCDIFIHDCSILHPWIYSFLFPSLLKVIFNNLHYSIFTHDYKVFLNIHHSSTITLNFQPLPSHWTPPTNRPYFIFM
jgi:hypothetical protein